MIDARTSVAFPDPENLDDPRQIGSIEITTGAVIVGARGATLIIDEFEGRPLRALWIGDRFAGLGHSSVEGETIDDGQIASILTAVSEGRVLTADEVQTAVVEGQRAGLRSDADMLAAPLRKIIVSNGEPGYLRQWHTRAGNVKTEYDEFEILRQITGISGWDFDFDDPRDSSFSAVCVHPAGISAFMTFHATAVVVTVTTPTGSVERHVSTTATIEPKPRAARKAA
jgi:hypothetical protein